nr:DUF3039 domain-containing protein [Angustibacter aerolatus]
MVGQDGGPGLGTRLIRFVGYFTVQSNLLVLLSTGLLALRPALDAWWLRVLRLDAIAGIAVTAGVHAVVLRPLQDLHGADLVADTGLHVVVPALAVVGWLACGPRRRVDVGTVVLALVWPVVYVAGTALHGAVSHWYPYPFTDVDEPGLPDGAAQRGRRAGAAAARVPAAAGRRPRARQPPSAARGAHLHCTLMSTLDPFDEPGRPSGPGGPGTRTATIEREQVEEQTAEPGDHERFAHYVRKEKILESALSGESVIALCGKVWVPGRNPDRFPVCPMCKEIYEGLRAPEDGGE